MDIFYNGILVAIVAIWLIGRRSAGMGRFATALKNHVKFLTFLMWIAFLAFAVMFVLYFSYFEDIHDIDDAVEAATASLEDGINPYEEYVVPRFKGKYAPNVEMTLGPYNYLPLDLIVYASAREIIGSLGSPQWFVVTNLVFSGAAMYLLRRIIDVELVSFAPLAGIVMLFYSFDNASLTMLLMVAAMYVRLRFEFHPVALSILIMGLAVVTKVYAVLPFAVLVLFELQASWVARSLWKAAQVVAASAASVAIAVLVMLPFGVISVLDAAVFFHGSEDARVGTSTGGTLLSELTFASDYMLEITLAVIAAGLLAGLKLRNMNDRVLLVTVAFLLVAVKSSLAPLTVAGVFLALRLWDTYCARVAQTPRPEVPLRSSPEPAAAPSGD